MKGNTGSTIFAFIIGVLAGGTLLYAILLGTNQVNPEGVKEIVQSPFPQIGGSPQPTSRIAQESRKEQLERLRERLFEEGINVNARVDNTFPGMGFIMVDGQGTRLFVRWEGLQLPERGQAVSVKGTVARLSNKFAQLKSDPDMTPELEGFLNDQSIFVEAQEVSRQ